jgi:trans-aconitate methyltransferase
MSGAKLLDLNKDWQQVRPFMKPSKNGFTITGYESYAISNYEIVPMSDNVRLKFDLVKQYLFADVSGKTVLDLGCSNMFFGFWSKLHGATKVTGVDLDKDYLKQNDQLIKHFKFSNTECVDMNAADYNVPADTVFAFAIIHWIYSCSGFLGSLEKVVEHLRNLTNSILYVEWVDPSDDCIADILHHTDFNNALTVKDYNKENFLRYLNKHFQTVVFCGITKSTNTREIYRCEV